MRLLPVGEGGVAATDIHDDDDSEIVADICDRAALGVDWSVIPAVADGAGDGFGR